MPTPAVFFDDGKHPLAPLRDLRPIFLCRTGPLTIMDRLARSLQLTPVAVAVPEDLGPLTEAIQPVPLTSPDSLPESDAVLVVNGRCPLPLDEIASLVERDARGTALFEAEGDLVAAYVDPAETSAVLDHAIDGAEPPSLERIDLADPVLISRPWHTRTVRDLSIRVDLDLLECMPTVPPAAGVTVLGEHHVRIHRSARVHPTVVLDAEKGPIVIDEGATVRPRATIAGPAYIGPKSNVLDAAIIKPNTSIGPVCKVAGEVGGTVFQGFANKSHDGHLGDSWIGEWVNLGAATVNSNLLNTYTEVTAVAEPGASRERTGETFFGCVLGDHVRTAIATRIMTGTIAHTGAMWAADESMTGTIERFCWASPKGRSTFRIDKFIDVARAAMSRRHVELDAAYIERLRTLAG